MPLNIWLMIFATLAAACGAIIIGNEISSYLAYRRINRRLHGR